MPEKQQPEAKAVEVEIAVDNHTHAGKPVKKGDKIPVTESQAEILRAHNVIK